MVDVGPGGVVTFQRFSGRPSEKSNMTSRLRVPRSMPLARAVADYQKHRVKKLKKQCER